MTCEQWGHAGGLYELSQFCYMLGIRTALAGAKADFIRPRHKGMSVSRDNEPPG
jgi:hypothetical protein